MTVERALVIGLDGATFRLLDPLVERGCMPGLAGVMERGERAVLHSTLPPVTAPAWGTFLTGKDPGSHGVFDWRSPLRSAEGRRLLSGADLAGPSLPEICARQKLPAVLVNIPMTYPPRETTGVLVTGMLTPSLESTFTWPTALSRDQLWRRVGYALDATPPKDPDDVGPFLERLRGMVRSRTAAVVELMSRVPGWRLCTVVFVAPDRLQHHCWHLFDESHPLHDPTFVEEALRFWTELDSCVGRLLREVGPDTPTMIVSDHGFGPLSYVVDLNAYLVSCGFLRYQRRAALRRLHLGLGIRSKLGIGDAADRSPVDWANTMAYSGSETEEGVYINVKGREPWGVVEQGAHYDELRDHVRVALEDLVDPATGRHVVVRCLKREHVYQGPWVERAPDLLLELASGYKVLNDLHRESLILPVGRGTYAGTGRHDRHGVLIAEGWGRLGTGPHHLRDVLPTVLPTVACRLPEGVEGRSMVLG